MFYPHDITKLLNPKEIIGESKTKLTSIQIDTRHQFLDSASVLFICLIGENHDGNTFIPQAYAKGIRHFICTKKPDKIELDAFYLVVPDSKLALWTLAKKYRNNFDYPVVGITGSNGKTIVKEWLYHLLSNNFEIERNPKSYNSQIGVPLALLASKPNADFGIFEAGISKPKEMIKHLRLLVPQIGILTNIGDAHQQNFSSIKEKIHEKIQLFTFSNVIIFNEDDGLVKSCIDKVYSEVKQFSWSRKNVNAKVLLKTVEKSENKCALTIVVKSKEYFITIPFNNKIDIENSMHCVAFLASQNLLESSILKRFLSLPKLTMRMDRRKGLFQSVLINDSYSNDLLSLKYGLQHIQNEPGKKGLILSDFVETFQNKTEYYADVISLIKALDLDLFVGVGSVWEQIKPNHKIAKKQFFYSNTLDFIKSFDRQNVNSVTILIKGARKFAFEHIVQVLSNKPHVASLEINIDNLIYNFQYFKSLLHSKTKIMVMLKAFSYGVGSIEIAKILRQQNVDSIAVAYPNEGIELRNSGIKNDILVLNPPLEFIEIMIENNLEPEIYNADILSSWIKTLENLRIKNYPIHLKFNTGMNRLGLKADEIKKISKQINSTKSVMVKSIFSHLVDSYNEESSSFTHQQLNEFENIISQMKSEFDYDFDTHILNTNGILNYNSFQTNQVRLGIGLFGTGIHHHHKKRLRPVLKLSSVISQINKIKKGESVGYNRSFIAKENMTVATVAIGYADGLLRVFGNQNSYLLVNNKPCEIIGNICMDMCMINITNVIAHIGDEVIVFDGIHRDLDEFSASGNMISYEVLCSLSERVQRNYTQEW